MATGAADAGSDVAVDATDTGPDVIDERSDIDSAIFPCRCICPGGMCSTTPQCPNGSFGMRSDMDCLPALYCCQSLPPIDASPDADADVDSGGGG